MEYGNILLIYKQQNQAAASLSTDISKWLSRRGIGVDIREAQTSYDFLAKEYNLVIVLGGDGTILGVARFLAGKGVPIFGINFGKVGFLTAASPCNCLNSLEKIFQNLVYPKNCLALRWKIEKNKKIIRFGHAINEVVLARGNLARLVSIELEINSQNLGVLRNDGIIISSPLGSAAYCASAGGPLLFPALQATVMVQISPFMSGFVPMVMQADCAYILKPDRKSSPCWLTIDGQEGCQLEPGQSLHVTGWPEAILFYGSGQRFFQYLQKRGAEERFHCVKGEKYEI